MGYMMTTYIATINKGIVYQDEVVYTVKKEVQTMEYALLEEMVCRQERQLLCGDSEWEALQKHKETLHQAFFKQYQENMELCSQVIDLVDANVQLLIYQMNLRFSIGVCLGMETASVQNDTICTM